MIGWLARMRRTEPLRSLRWVVVDCESSGLDPARDRLLSIGAVAVREGRIDLADSFAAVLRQERASEPGNILVHGIGAEAQLAGREPGTALGEFSAYAGGRMLAAFHADFDRTLLERAIPGWKARWLDLAQIAPALFPARANACKSLDDWLAAFGISHLARHDALADAFATAQLLLVLLTEAERQGLDTTAKLSALGRSRRWLG